MISIKYSNIFIIHIFIRPKLNKQIYSYSSQSWHLKYIHIRICICCLIQYLSHTANYTVQQYIWANHSACAISLDRNHALLLQLYSAGVGKLIIFPLPIHASPADKNTHTRRAEWLSFVSPISKAQKGYH